MTNKLLIVGATGATGRHVVQMILDRGDSVVVVARSKESMLGHLKEVDYGDRLMIHEAAILDLSEEDLVSMTKDCSVVISCLGHSMTFSGIFMKPRSLVTEAVKRLTKAMPSSAKFILMGSDGVAHPNDPKQTFAERSVIFLLRYLIPPHADNERAAAFLFTNKDFDWSVVRPTNLINEEKADGLYTISEYTECPLFGDQTVSRNNVAHFMVEMITNEKTFAKYRHKMPVLVGKKKEGEK
jgi:putative NADH-flavin reductase